MDEERFDIDIIATGIGNDNDLYMAGENVSPKCEMCGKTIIGHPIEVDKTIYIGDEKGEKMIPMFALFCSKECEYLNNIISFEHKMMGNLKSIINHLIKEHCYEIAILENALNSEFGKKIRKNIEQG